MAEKRGMKALELWCRRVTEGYPGVKIENMTTSWRDGLAFCALIHHFRPDLIDFDRLDKRDIYKNNELAFRIAERQLGIPALLDAEDMVEYEVPDRLSILTYLSQFYQTFVSNQQGSASPSPRKHASAVSDILSSAPKTPSSKVGSGRLETCWSCRRPVFLAERLVAGGKLRHRTCFTCKRCGHQLNLVGSYETEGGDFVCETCPDEEKTMEENQRYRQQEELERQRGEQPTELPPSEPPESAPKADGYSIEFEDKMDALILQSRATDSIKSKFLSGLIASDAGDADCGDSVTADDIKEEVTLIIDKIIEEALRRVEKEEKEEKEEEKADVTKDEKEEPDVTKVVEEEELSVSAMKEEPKPVRVEVKEPKKSNEDNEYPEDLNPFAEEEEPVQLRKDGRKVIDAAHLNPFWSDAEHSSDEDSSKPVPAPRTSLRPQDKTRFGSNVSLTSIASRKKKAPAPPPPPIRSSPDNSRSPVAPSRTHRKSRPAPPPPSSDNQKKEKDYENKVKQNMSTPDKSTYGKWKRKKGQAPSLPIPQRRRIVPLPLPDLFRELEDLEVQQRELERQGVTIEQTIRQYESEDGSPGENGGKDVEALILQLFEIVNQKNELFRRQAELMYLRRQQRLEEEHADIEYQIRCLMGRPERNKTDSDKAQEEELIRRLVEVVERRNEIIECLDMDRRREVEEDRSIHHHLEVFAGKGLGSDADAKSPTTSSSTSSPHHHKSGTLLRLIKKKKSKKEKSKKTRDADKDVDESGKDDGVEASDGKHEKEHQPGKTKKKWFAKVT